MEHAPAPHPVDDVVRILRLKVGTPAGEAHLELPWDVTAYQLEPLLAASGEGDGERTVTARTTGPDGDAAVDVLELPLGKALRSPENSAGAEALVIEVETSAGRLAYVVRCEETAEPEVHVPYPRGRSDEGRRLVQAFHRHEEPDWFCDASSTLACCESARAAPERQQWVTV